MRKFKKEQIKKALSIVTMIGGFLIMVFGIFNFYATSTIIVNNNIEYSDYLISFDQLTELQNDSTITDGEYVQQIDTSLRLTTLASMISVQNMYLFQFIHFLTILIGVQFIAIGKLFDN